MFLHKTLHYKISFDLMYALKIVSEFRIFLHKTFNIPDASFNGIRYIVLRNTPQFLPDFVSSINLPICNLLLTNLFTHFTFRFNIGKFSCNVLTNPLNEDLPRSTSQYIQRNVAGERKLVPVDCICGI